MYIRDVIPHLMIVAITIGAVHPTVADLVTFEAESGTLGANFTNGTEGAVSFISISTDTVNTGNPGNANRVATYTITFPAAGTYNLYARLRVGSMTFQDDSLFYGNGFGSKSSTSDSSWIMVNGLASGGFTASGDIVSGEGSAGSLVWKWVNLSQFNPSGSGTETPITFTVPEGSLTQTFQIGGRENGLSIDKFVFGEVGVSLAVSNLDTGTLPPTVTLTNSFPQPDGNTLHRFSILTSGRSSDGANPAAGLVYAGGFLIGSTLNGGLWGSGTAFYSSLDGTTFGAFRQFTNAPDAGNPQGELALAGNNFFGATLSGGANGAGAIFLGQTNGNFSLLRSLAAIYSHNATNDGGASPGASLALSDGTLYGIASAGGASANGTIFSLTTNGATFSVLHDFSALDLPTGTNTDGAFPQGGLIVLGDRLYGTTSSGGNFGGGVIFSIRTDGSDFTTLHNFPALDPGAGTNSDGAMPLGGLALLGDRLYGTTFSGGSGGRGTVFSIQTNGLNFAVLHQFASVDIVTGTNADGASPSAALTPSGNTLYGTASSGGSGAAGTVFAINASGQFNTLYSFTAVAANGTNADGAFPVAPVVRVNNSLYGTTFSGGPGASGAVFSLPLPKPPAVIEITANQNGSLTLDFLGAPNSTNIVQAALQLSNLVNWQNISTNVANTNGIWQLIQFNQTNSMFYRSYAL